MTGEPLPLDGWAEPPAPSPLEEDGPVRAGVDETIRRLEELGVIEKSRSRTRSRHAGLVAQARSLAGSIDRASGEGGRTQASGVSLGTLHERLAAILERLDPLEAAGEEDDAWTELSRKLQETPTTSPVQVDP